MHIFLTGATGYIGSAVLDALLKAEHRVTVMVRDAEKAAAAAARGASPVLGDLRTPARYLAHAASADAVVHTAIASGAHGPALDRAFLDAVLPAQAATGRPRTFIFTSAIWVLGAQPHAADETAPLAPATHVAWRPGHEARVLEAASSTLRTAVIRPGIVYGGGRGIVAEMVKDALNGLVRVTGDGANHWPCIYQRDLGDLYERVVSTPTAAGVFHATDEQDEAVADIARALAEHVTPVADIRFVPLAEARAKHGAYADALALDQIIRSPRAHALGWAPTLHGITANVPRLFEEYRGAAPEE